MIYYLNNFDDLIQIGFWDIPKTSFSSLCKPINCIKIIPASPGLLNLHKLERKEKNIKNEYLANEKCFLDELKSFFIIFEMFSSVKI